VSGAFECRMLSDPDLGALCLCSDAQIRRGEGIDLESHPPISAIELSAMEPLGMIGQTRLQLCAVCLLIIMGTVQSLGFGSRYGFGSGRALNSGGSAASVGSRPSRSRSHSAPTQLSAHVEKYCLNVNLYIKEERRGEFIQCIKNNQV
jgi:hypothetical protein